MGICTMGWSPLIWMTQQSTKTKTLKTTNLSHYQQYNTLYTRRKNLSVQKLNTFVVVPYFLCHTPIHKTGIILSKEQIVQQYITPNIRNMNLRFDLLHVLF